MSTVVHAGRRVPKPLWWVLAGTLILLLATFSPAAAGDCPAVDNQGNPRDCTAMEQYGQCLTNALDSRDQCLERAERWWQRAGCEVAWSVDFWACTAALPVNILAQYLT